MLTYVDNILKQFNHKKPRNPQDQLYPYTKPVYGAKAQFSKQKDMSKILSQENKNPIKKSLEHSSTTLER